MLMNILLACQKSGYLRELLRAQGHNAWTCDIDRAEDGSEYHFAIDVRRVLIGCDWIGWDCMIAMPECRYLCSSGQHRTGKPGQRTAEDVENAVDFFMTLVNAPIEHIAIENSIGIMSTRYRKPDQIVQPHWFGDDASKSTCFWMKNFPLLQSTEYVHPRTVNGKLRWANQTDSGQNRLGPSPTRSADRARTYPGIARALAASVAKLDALKGAIMNTPHKFTPASTKFDPDCAVCEGKDRDAIHSPFREQETGVPHAQNLRDIPYSWT